MIYTTLCELKGPGEFLRCSPGPAAGQVPLRNIIYGSGYAGVKKVAPYGLTWVCGGCVLNDFRFGRKKELRRELFLGRKGVFFLEQYGLTLFPSGIAAGQRGKDS